MGSDSPSGDMGNDDKPFDDEPFDAGIEADEESDPKKYIQQLAGKLGQTLRNYTETQGGADLELEKFAINSVISATHTSDMDPNDRKDIIKKINTSGQDAGGENDDFGDDIASAENDGGSEDESGEDIENTFGEGIQILPKDHKQVFKDAKLGVNENSISESCWKGYKQVGMKEKDGKQVPNCVPIDEKNSIFAENKDMNETEEPLVKPKTTPIVKPNEQPKRREKPWRISPQEAPQPKAEK